MRGRQTGRPGLTTELAKNPLLVGSPRHEVVPSPPAPATPRLGVGAAREPRDTRFLTMGSSTEGLGSPPGTLRRPPEAMGNKTSAQGAGFEAME